MIEANRDAFEQRKNELEALLNLTRDRTAEKQTKEGDLIMKGNMIQD